MFTCACKPGFEGDGTNACVSEYLLILKLVCGIEFVFVPIFFLNNRSHSRKTLNLKKQWMMV